MHATDIFDRFQDLNIVIVGDIMIDRYVYGSVDRISPEAPVPVVHLQREENRLGGAANVALNIQALGAKPFLFSVIGDDENGNLLTQLLPASDISADYILRSKARTTTVKTRVIAQHQHLLRVDREDASPLAASDMEQLVAKLHALLNEQTIHLILFQDYNKGVLTPSFIEATISEAKARGIATAVDPKYDNFWAYRGVTFFKPNLREIQQQIDPHLRPELVSLQMAAREIEKRLANKFTMITLSDKGLFIQGDGKTEIIPTQPRSIADVCGAGDTVISVAALGVALGISLKDVAILANLAGGQVCEKIGVVPVNKAQLEQEYQALLDKQ